MTRTALYRVYGGDDALLYVGISNSFGRRWAEHAAAKPWWAEARRQTITWYDSRQEAGEAELAAISAENPAYNIKGKPLLVDLLEEPPARPRRISATPDEIDWLIAHYEEHGCSAFGCGCACRFPAMNTDAYHELRADAQKRSRRRDN